MANQYLRLFRVAGRLEGLARCHGLNITFFGDDILISGERPFNGLTSHFRQIIESCGLKLHPQKTLPVAGPGHSHKALGIIMNSFGTHIDVPRTYRRKVQSLIALCRHSGPSALRVLGVTTTDPKAYLRGKIAFATYINPRNASLLEDLEAVGW